jgi:hypothetical protein
VDIVQMKPQYPEGYKNGICEITDKCSDSWSIHSTERTLLVLLNRTFEIAKEYRFSMRVSKVLIALSAMGINMALVGVPDSFGVLIPFLLITLLNLFAAFAILKHVEPSNTLKSLS